MSDNIPRQPVDGVPVGPASVEVVRLRQLTPGAMWVTAIVIATLTAAAVVGLWWPATAGLNGADLVTARLDALKIGLSIGVGSGGVVALYLAWRRQHSTEADLDNRERSLFLQQQVAGEARADATARRITELYLKAVEQLGSDKAPVRLGGLYALERVAQDNRTQRQTIVNVWCAYLRMPFTPPDEPPTVDEKKDVREDYRDQVQEREVRLTAQRLLTEHLTPGANPESPVDTFWAEMNLDLAGAVLINFTLTSCTARAVTFDLATFIGGANFDSATFTSDADFISAKFTNYADFDLSTFIDYADFEAATFTSYANFGSAEFPGGASFDSATFTGSANFGSAKFPGGASFDSATFTGSANFDSASFSRYVNFSSATFINSANFGSTKFTAPPAKEDVVTAGMTTDFRGTRFVEEPPAELAPFL
ncbi:pentapeptide repeat-containing protein [Amycolatopsis sp.]|uniref:pentapeptide repeat-containing protein n=1 Tax=Amycolatopsis sp. TaxID=37632 RepID=UPI0026103568|nr:pentapeptide repeat-containing protein [Amycolatopsis sp.]